MFPLQSLSDNQVALLGCAAALFISGVMAWASYHLGRSIRQRNHRPDGTARDALPFSHRGGDERRQETDTREKAA